MLKRNLIVAFNNQRLAEAASLLYLLVPFVLFLFGWYKILVAVLGTGLVAWIFWRIFQSGLSEQAGATTQPDSLPEPGRGLVWALFLLIVWVFLSGIGGYAFQNWDFNGRNAIFRDLITHPWPVFYPDPGKPPLEMVYYIGFWLPSALVGKLLGWLAANFSLFLWTLLGVFLVVRLLSFRVRASLPAIALFLIFFSGMDILSLLLFQATGIRTPDALWPPTRHLEWWAVTIQYSSFTTQLFWVFNQALPAWICMALFLNCVQKKYAFFLWSLCLFFAPLPALGFAPFIAVHLLSPDPSGAAGRVPEAVPTRLHCLYRRAQAFLSIENVLGGGTVTVLSMAYFSSSNTTGQLLLRDNLALIILSLAFVMIEGGLLWLLLFRLHRRDPLWIAAGLMLFTFPLVLYNYERDFCMRASIPPLFVLMVGCMEVCLDKEKRRHTAPLAYILAPLLMIGMFTPVYEINRSIYRTSGSYLCPYFPQLTFLCSRGEWRPGQDPGRLDNPFMDERDHPGTLLADQLVSLDYLDRSFHFFGYLEKSPLQVLLGKGYQESVNIP